MTHRYLFGPVDPAFVSQNLYRARHAGECLAFDTAGHTDLQITPADTWETVQARLPNGWTPDLVVLYLPYTTIPPWLWQAPIPLVGLAADWNLLWHGYRHILPLCDLVFTDSTGVDAMHRQGLHHVRSANLFGCEQAFLKYGYPDGPRDIDIAFVGNLHPAVQRDRLPWLAGLAGLSERRKVVIRSGVFGDAYRDLLGRARVVFNRSIRGEANKRAFEAAAAGALLFQEEGNRELPAYFRDRHECVYYGADNLEALLDYYLDHEDERQAIADAARQKVQTLSFADLWERTVADVDEDWDTLVERAQRRPRQGRLAELRARTWQALASSTGPEAGLAGDLATALVDQPAAADVHNALGLIPPPDAAPAQGAGYFRRALAHNPRHVVTGLNLAAARLCSAFVSSQTNALRPDELCSAALLVSQRGKPNRPH